MNNNNQGILKVAGICIVVGIILTIIFASTSGKNYVHNGHIEIGSAYDTTERENIHMDFNEDGEEITKLNFAFSIGDCKIVEGDKFSLDVKDSFKNGFDKTEKDGDTLIIEQSTFNFFPQIFNMSNHLPQITVTIPKGREFEKFEYKSGVGHSEINDITSDTIYMTFGTGDTKINNLVSTDKSTISSGVGKVEINTLKSDKLEINSGVGEFKCNDVKSDDTTISSGTGDIDMNNSDLNDLELDCGVGNVKINGKLTGDIDIDGGVGNVTFDIDGNPSDYFLKSDDGVGDIRLNGKDFGEESGSSSADNRISIDGGVGNININID